MMQNTLATQAMSEIPNRSHLIQEALKAAMSATFGLHPINEQEVNHLVGELVKSKLLTAEQSYQFKDRLFDRKSFDRYIEQRTEEAINKRSTSVFTQQIANA